MSDPVGDYLRGCVAAGDIPSASWVVAGPGGVLASGACGDAVVEPERVPATTDTIYDLASLTKPLVTSTLYLLLRRELDLDPERPIRTFLPELDRQDKRDITLEHLLTHTSGMPAWVPFYLKGSSIEEYLGQLRDRPPEQPPGSRVVYSCAGFILLGEILQRCATAGLDRLTRDLIVSPLDLAGTTFLPPPSWHRRVAATEDSCEYERNLAGADAEGYAGFRRGVIRGEVHDQNAWTLGGVAGNAGLFSTAFGVATMAAEFLGSRMAAQRGLLGEEEIALAFEDRTPGLEEARTFAFRLASRGETAAGPDLPSATAGHNGFTGTSVWIDPLRPRVYVLLTNRVHPRVREEVDMIDLRRTFHTLASRI